MESGEEEFYTISHYYLLLSSENAAKIERYYIALESGHINKLGKRGNVSSEVNSSSY